VSDQREEARRAIIKIIALLNREHERHLEPYIRRLCEIDAIYLPALRLSATADGEMKIENVTLRQTIP
jgi:hypothetical protein